MAMHPPIELVNSYPTEWDDRPYRGQCAYLPHPRPRAGYAAMITDLDRHVGAVIKQLKKAGIYDDTLIIFTSDNGPTHMRNDPQFGVGGIDLDFFNSGGGLREAKGSVYEGGLRVPTILRLPGAIPSNHVDHTVGYFADWFPTLAAAMQLDAPNELDGENLWPALTNSIKSQTRKPMLWVYPEYGGQVAVMFGDIKVLRRNLKTKQPGDWEVYNVADDPAESNNLAASHHEQILEAIALLQAQTLDNPLFPLEIPKLD
jgi:arylsulfatase A-like enzyme